MKVVSNDNESSVAACSSERVMVRETGIKVTSALPHAEDHDWNPSTEQFTTRLVRAMQWLLAFAIFAVLSWVGIFTVLGTHTDVVRDDIYPGLSSKYLEEKEGARIFTYLGVFYIVGGIVSLGFLSGGVRLPKPTPKMARSFRLPLLGEYWSVLELCALIIFVLVQVATITTRVMKRYHEYYSWPADKLWYEVSKTLGKTAAITLSVLFLPVCKSCFWWDLFNCKFERAVKFHRFLAWFWVLVVIVHATTATASLVLAGQFKECTWPSDACQEPGVTYKSFSTSRRIMYGWIAGLIMLPLVLTSLPWFRRHKFEWFYYTHFLFVPALILMHLHFPDLIYYTAPGLAAYVLDKIVWWCSSRRPAKIISLRTTAPGFVRLAIALEPGFSFEPGQWIQLKVPAVSRLEWHPMSVASAPGHSSFTVDIKVLGDWTRGLETLATKFDPSLNEHTRAFVDKFHGSSHSQMHGYLSHPAVLMIAGGIGVTPMMSALRKLVEDGASLPVVRRAVLVWVVRKESVIDLYREELTRLQALTKTANGCDVDVLVYATLSEKEDDAEFVPVEIEVPRDETIPRSDSSAPFRQLFKGYSQMLVLTVTAGVGYFAGIYAANVISYEKTAWPYEYTALLQLGLALIFTTCSIIAGISISSTHCFQSSANRKRCSSDESKMSLNEENTCSSTDACFRSQFEVNELRIVVGCRPNLNEILNDTGSWCNANKCSTAGVSVCGPEQLVQAVFSGCRQASSSTVQFVVDDETFDW
jgi:predicted ferric reductase